MDGVRLDLADGGCSATWHFLLPLDAVLRTGLLAVADAGGVQRPAHDLVAHARQVLDAAPAHEHDGVLLQVVALARDVGRDLDATGDADTRDLAQRGVRLLRGRRVHARAHTTALRGGHLLLAALAGLEARGGQLLGLRRTSLADELARGRHAARDGSEVRPPASRRGANSRALGPPMSAMRIPEGPDLRWGVFTRDELRAAGLSDTGIARRVKTGELHRMYRDVYSVAPPVLLRPEARWRGAVLACGPDAALSHRSAAVFWELLEDRW